MQEVTQRLRLANDAYVEVVKQPPEYILIDLFPPYLRTRLRQRGELLVTYFPGEDTYGDIVG